MYKTVTIVKCPRKTRLKELKTKGVKDLSKVEVEELLEILIDLIK